MGVILPFKPRAAQQNFASPEAATDVDMFKAEQTIRAARHEGYDVRTTMAAAQPLLDLCRERYGFTVMRDGLPDEPEALVDAFLNLSQSLCQLDTDVGDHHPRWNYGVYFGQQKLSWFEDGYGEMSALAVPHDIDVAELTEFIRSRTANRH